jgi:hypothetical protein
MVVSKKVRVYTRDLQNPKILEMYIQMGFLHILRIIPRVPSKFPTIGCVVELSCYVQQGSTPIHSLRGQKIIQRLSW